jgi:hypothetical protein
MGMDLCGVDNERYFRVGNVAWAKALHLARNHGWEPAGTIDDGFGPAMCNGDDFEPGCPIREERGRYDYNDGWVVTHDDARAIADALEKALDDIPSFESVSTKWAEEPVTPLAKAVAELAGDQAARVRGPNRVLSPYEFFSGGDKQMVWEFIAFCRQGAFRIL